MVMNKIFYTVIKASCFLLLSLILFISESFAEPAESCLVAEKEQNIQRQIELFTDCIHAEFQKIQQQKVPNLNNLSVGYLGRALAYSKAGNMPLAKEDYDTSIHLNPTIPRSYKYRGLLLSILHKYDDAISDFSKAIIYSESDPELLILRGKAYGELRKYKLAIEDLEKAKKIDPGNALAYSLLGQFYCATERYKEAIGSYDKSIEIKPKDAATLNSYAFCLLTATSSEVRDYPKALKLAKTVFEELDENSSALLETLAAAYAGNGDFKKAVETLQRALEHAGPDDIGFVEEMNAALENYKKGELYYK